MVEGLGLRVSASIIGSFKVSHKVSLVHSSVTLMVVVQTREVLDPKP